MIPLLQAVPASVVVAPFVRRTWEGWGTSLCWMGNAFGERDDLADLLFSMKRVTLQGQALPGLGLNIVRYNAGACSPGSVEGRQMMLSKNVLPFRQIEGLWLDPAKGEAGWDWARDRAQQAMMLKAKSRGADRFELFSNSPMWWMCKNANPSGAAKATDDNLRPDGHRAFAEYLATLADQAPRRWGVRFTSVEPFNEPASDYWSATGRQEGCHFDPSTQAEFLPVLREALDRRGLRKLPIVASDETSFDQALVTWNSLPPGARALIERVNVHGYAYTKGKREDFTAAIGDKPRWNSEHGDGEASGLPMARELSQDLNVLRATAWCYWQPLDGGGWGLLDCDLPRATVKDVNPKLFVMAQYTRHIRPGMTILGTGDPQTVAAYDPKRRRLVLVAANEKEAATRSFDLSAFRLSRGAATLWTTVPAGKARYERATAPPATGSALTLDLPAGSVTTIEIAGVSVR